MKFPRKHLVMMTFLSSMLRDDVRIVNTIDFPYSRKKRTW